MLSFIFRQSVPQPRFASSSDGRGGINLGGNFLPWLCASSDSLFPCSLPRFFRACVLGDATMAHQCPCSSVLSPAIWRFALPTDRRMSRARASLGIPGPMVRQQLTTQGLSRVITQGLRRVLLKKQQEFRMRPRSQADTEADSLEDLNLEDLDNQELEDLFETYGEVVREESVPTPTTSEADDDAESLELAVALAEVANDVKASEIRVLCVKPLVYWTRFFVIATGFSRPQVDAIGQRMRNMAEERFKRTPKGDLKPNSWTLLDFGDVVVHIFYPKERSFYNLEEFYGNATNVELPFESQPQSQVL